MRNELVIAASIAAALAALPVIGMAQTSVSQNVALADLDTSEAARVTQTVDSRAVTAVAHSHLAFIAAAKPTAAVADSTPMNHMQLVLKRSAKRAAALDALVAAQHDPTSNKFHQWITPQQFGSRFGVSDADIAAVTSWLTSQGFTVNGVYANKMQIDFNGTAGAVKRAFHTQESRYTINNESHIANGGDISVPTALKDVVTGVAGLNDIRPKAQHVQEKLAQFNASSQKFKIQQPATTNTRQLKSQVSPDAVNFTNGSRGFSPSDMAKIYGVDTLHTAGTTGKGITIALVEDESMVPTDWNNFVTQFQLGSYGGTFAQIQPQATGFTNCIDPNIAFPGSDGIETVLDAEWSTAMAPGANIVVASCDDSNSSNFFGGVFTAATNLINGTSQIGRAHV